jgi:hypothetical protein
MDITIITLVISAITAVFTGLFGILSHVKKCHAGCCDSDCTKTEEEREAKRLSRNTSKTKLSTIE